MGIYQTIAEDVILGQDVFLAQFVNLYGCSIGDYSRIGTFVEIQKGVHIGSNCKIQSHSFICEGVRIKNRVFIGHGVTFINDKLPKTTNLDGTIKRNGDWTCTETTIEDEASIGSGSTILCGINIGRGAVIGAGSVVTKNVPDGQVWVGNPAKPLKEQD
ncbi:MAG: N-acetyltransferase [Nitrospinales bacterium]|jgi:acetyltransferase-like isoleucine patch superfamily enzyme|uniref:N-acetyltransferase n=1 Tax=marine metagenome TaxID=408172 RepID=A0A381U1Q5_9ZZZZ|nr:N-acetyltransferase [Nitrospinales bacterium]|tara:strand:- start:779 stop:1255 length:477 start_codon:yes stop_codon:yes gene_type:complete